MPSLTLLQFFSAGAVFAKGTLLSSYDSGAKFDKCIKITDWETKTLDDDIELVERDATSGCCPDDTVPGVKHYSTYVGAQVVCGWKADGSISFSTSSSNGVNTCTYNTCYVVKMDYTCQAGSKLRLNGCCAAPADCSTNACGFNSTCKNYAYSMSNVFGDDSEYCLTYHKNYALEHTSDKSDDQANDMLQLGKLYYYTPCVEIFDPLAGLEKTTGKLADYGQGAKFDKCIRITDWESKTLDDEIDLYSRDSSGCCPDNTVPGVQHYTNYWGAQVECGWKADGSVSFSTSSSNGVNTCTYNNCFVIKQSTKCADDSQMHLNGCCAAPADCSTNACGFGSTCKNYAYSMSNVFEDSTEYCLTYHQDYKLENTVALTDDIKDGNSDAPSLDTSALYTYTACASLPAPGTVASTARSQHMLSVAVTTVAAAAAAVGWSLLTA